MTATRIRKPGTGRPGARARRRSAVAAVAAARPRLTGRAAVLVLVLAALVVSYASSFRAYLEQRRQISSLEAGIARSRDDIAALEREKQRWHDPAYVVSQARARFAFGFPGEIGFQVLDADGRPLGHQDSLDDTPAPPDDPEWWQTTLASIDAAAHPPKVTPRPATRITPPDAADKS